MGSDFTSIVRSGQYAGVSVKVLDATSRALITQFGNASLVPVVDPVGGCLVQGLLIQAEVDGFSLLLNYPHSQGTDEFDLRFTLNPSATGDDPTLLAYRKQITDLQGMLVGGIAVDYLQGQARWLGPGMPAGQGARSELAPVDLLNQEPPKLSLMPALYSYVPEVKATIRN